jgi:hypothetical protein
MRRIAILGTFVVALHATVVGLHSLAHARLQIPVSLFNAFVVAVAVAAAGVLWTRRRRTGGGLLLAVMAVSLILATYNHFIARGADFVGGIAAGPGQFLFQVTAVLRMVAEVLGCWVGLRALRAAPGVKAGAASPNP